MSDTPKTAPVGVCIHAKLQLQLVVPEECFIPGEIGAWYKCERCGEEFRTDLKPYQIVVRYGTTSDDPKAAPTSPSTLSRDATQNAEAVLGGVFDHDPGCRAPDYGPCTCKRSPEATEKDLHTTLAALEELAAKAKRPFFSNEHNGRFFDMAREAFPDLSQWIRKLVAERDAATSALAIYRVLFSQQELNARVKRFNDYDPRLPKEKK